ncbi:MAG: hypothetical protein ACRYG6_00300 [Janthinobacterium lividum]
MSGHVRVMRVLVLLPCLALMADGLHAQPAPVAVTTDTPEYCARMIAQVETRPDLTAEMHRLLDEGRHLCERGEVRGGIMRLRRAMLLIQGREHAEPRD